MILCCLIFFLILSWALASSTRRWALVLSAARTKQKTRLHRPVSSSAATTCLQTTRTERQTCKTCSAPAKEAAGTSHQGCQFHVGRRGVDLRSLKPIAAEFLSPVVSCIYIPSFYPALFASTAKGSVLPWPAFIRPMARLTYAGKTIGGRLSRSRRCGNLNPRNAI